MFRGALSSFSSSISIAPYCCFQRYSVASLMFTSRQTVCTGSPPSIRHKIKSICSGVCFFPFWHLGLPFLGSQTLIGNDSVLVCQVTAPTRRVRAELRLRVDATHEPATAQLLSYLELRLPKGLHIIANVVPKSTQNLRNMFFFNKILP